MRVIGVRMAKTQVPQERRDEQRALKDICGRVKQRVKKTWPLFWSDVIGIHVGIDYEKNLANGEAGIETANKIRDWIIAHELELAAEIYPQYFTRDLRTDWDGFVDDKGEYGNLHTVPYKPLTLHEISSHHPVSPTRLKLFEEFTFELDSPLNGSVIALDCYKGDWYPIPLHEDNSFIPIPVANGLYGFPIRDCQRRSNFPPLSGVKIHH